MRFAPFLVAGMYVAYFCGGLASTITIGCSAAVFVWLIVKRNPIAVSVAGLLCGTFAMLIYVNFIAEPVMEYTHHTVVTDIKVKEVIGVSNDKQHIIAKVELNGIKANVRLFSEVFLDEGQTASAEISFRPNDEQWKLYSLANNIYLSGDFTVISEGEISKIQGLPYLLRQVRERMADVTTQYISSDLGELTLAVMFGMDERLPEYLSEQLCVSGAAHFIAVSGSHFSVLAAIFMSVISDKRSRYRAWIALLFVPIAVLFFGTSNSVIRAAVMFLICATARLFHRESDTLNSLCLAVTVICLISPSAVLDVGFAMSVLGTFGAGVVGVKAIDRLSGILPKKKAKLVKLASPLILSLAVIICTAPISVAVFKGVSVAGVFTTAVLMPLMSVGMFLILLLGVTGNSFVALALGLIMKLVGLVVNTFGSIEAMWLPMNYDGAVAITVITAVAVSVWAIGSFRWFEASAACVAVLAVFSMTVATFVRGGRAESVVVQGDDSTAQIFIVRREAVVIINGTGEGLCDALPEALRANGVRSIIDISAIDADYGCAVMIDDIAERFEVKHISVNYFADGFLEIP